MANFSYHPYIRRQEETNGLAYYASQADHFMKAEYKITIEAKKEEDIKLIENVLREILFSMKEIKKAKKIMIEKI